MKLIHSIITSFACSFVFGQSTDLFLLMELIIGTVNTKLRAGSPKVKDEKPILEWMETWNLNNSLEKK